MFALTSATRIYLCAGATDMRKSFNGLYALARNHLNQDPQSGHLFIFCNRSRDRIKVFFWDRGGFWVCAKRLEKGTFAWPLSTSNEVTLDASELHLLLGGIDLKQTRPRKWFVAEKKA